MTVNRRKALESIGVAGIVGLAGCASVQKQGGTTEGGDGGDGGGGTTSGEDSGQAGTTESGPAGTAKAWYSLQDTELQARKQALKRFNGNSKHTVEGADISDLKKKTTSAIPAGQGPQLFDWAHDWVGDYYQRGFVADRSDQLNVSLDTFTDTAAEAVQFDGKVVGLPYAAETVSLIYNKSMVDEPPKTVADMKSAMKEHHDPNNNTYGLSYPFDPYFVSAWGQAFGGYYFDPEKDPMLGLTQSKTLEGFQFALDTFKPYMPKDPSYETQAAPFASGNAAFAINGPWYLATLNEKGVDFGVTKLPTPDGGQPRPYTGIQMWYFAKAMQNDDASAAAAQSFAEWYVTDEKMLKSAAQEQGSIPVLESLAGSDALPENVRAFSETVQQGVPMPTDPKMGKVWQPLTDAVTKMFNGNVGVEKAMKQAEKTVRKNWE
ncbi:MULTISPECIES: extracellular solute-binding protein [Halorussus]|uniref:extracellular solute-binding protein n=1 Tax=Halorussus TaxID=1070314 RepID=UPI00209EAF0F|nr:extracellular solute-binding protein [Halorussus vallis]USZ77963.1 extracellular solute-binding protein [Halorussus vallis]USZ77997.1 extracellular solute-binding protein [Halorussus vallis]